MMPHSNRQTILFDTYLEPFNNQSKILFLLKISFPSAYWDSNSKISRPALLQ